MQIPTLALGDVLIHRPVHFSQAQSFLPQCVELVNSYLPAGYDRITMEYFTTPSLALKDGRVVDLSNQWEGLSLLAVRDGKVCLLCLSRQEKLVTDQGLIPTERGFVPLIVASPEVRGGVLTLLVAALAARKLWASGVTEINGSCEITNKPVDRLYTALARERWIEDEKWIRYIYDNALLTQAYRSAVERSGMPESELLEFLGI